MVKKQISQQKKIFLDTIKDIRKLVGKHRGQYTKDVMGLNKKNTKVPFTHLQGRRQKLHRRQNKQKQRARQEVIQYDSSMKLLNSSVMEIHKQKDDFEKNKYKFDKVSSGKVGVQKDGFLHIRKVDLARINDTLDKPRFQKEKKFGKQQGSKNFKFRKGNKGKGKGKGKRR